MTTEKERTIWDVINNLTNKRYNKADYDLYDPFVVNRFFSRFKDTVFLAQELNIHYHMPIEAQYDYYFYGTIKQRRYAKWHKPEPDSEVITIISELFHVSKVVAREYTKIFSKDDLKYIEGMKGGLNK